MGPGMKRFGLALLALGALICDPCLAERKPIAVQTLQDLRFGRLVKEPARSGVVLVDPADGVRLFSGGVYDLDGDYGPAEFEISGEPGATFRITPPGGLSLGSGCRVVAVTVDPGLVGTLGANGKAIVRLGGKLELRPNSAHGMQKAVLTVQAEYL